MYSVQITEALECMHTSEHQWYSHYDKLYTDILENANDPMIQLHNYFVVHVTTIKWHIGKE